MELDENDGVKKWQSCLRLSERPRGDEDQLQTIGEIPGTVT